jgi:outer membrane immunogenic protein
MVAPASAADMAVKAAPAPAYVAPIYDWTGFYIGANGGWGQSRNCWDIIPVAGAVFPDGCLSRSGGVIGGQLGYRWQMGAAVFGVEAQGDWANISGSHVSLLNNLFTTGVTVNGLGLFTGQIGYTWGAGLLYFKGGGAVTSNTAFIDTVGGIGLVNASSTRWGGTVGVGFEYLFTPNWSAGIEYDHLFMGTSNNSFACAAVCAQFLNDRISQDVDMLTVRLNYKFGAYGAPVVSKY